MPDASSCAAREREAREEAMVHGRLRAERAEAVRAYFDHVAQSPDTDEGRAAKIVWRKSEDLFIAGAVRRFGTQWPQIAAHLPGRSDDAVRNRWHRLQKTHQKPLKHPENEIECEALLEASHAAVQAIVIRESSDRSRAPWTADEDRIIEDGVAAHGLKWRLIVAQLPGRSDSSARNRWLRMQKERHEGSGTEPHAAGSPSPARSATPSPPSSPQPPEPLSTPKPRPALAPGSPQITWPPVAVELAPSAPAVILADNVPTLMRYSYFAAGLPIASVLPLSH